MIDDLAYQIATGQPALEPGRLPRLCFLAGVNL
jgi:hypothetical protein